MLAWAAGATAYHAAAGFGSTIAAFAVAMTVYIALARRGQV
jgi:hypothetical protein